MAICATLPSVICCPIGVRIGRSAQALRRVAPFARVAQVDRKARQPLDGLADVLAADRARHQRLHVGDVQAVAGGRGAVDLHVDVAPAGEPLGQRRRHAGHALGHLLDLARRRGRSRPGLVPLTLTPIGLLMPVASMSMRLRIGGTQMLRQPRHLDRAVEFLDQLLGRHAGAPLLARLELDRGLEHLQRRRVGGGLGAAGLAEHALDFGHGLDHAVGLLQQLAGLLRRQAGQRRGHVEQVALVERRQELAAQAHQRPGRRGQQQQRRSAAWPSASAARASSAGR